MSERVVAQEHGGRAGRREIALLPARVLSMRYRPRVCPGPAHTHVLCTGEGGGELTRMGRVFAYAAHLEAGAANSDARNHHGGAAGIASHTAGGVR